MELYFLGTGAGQPSKKRNVTSIALVLLQERGTYWLIDCGEGTQHQILSSPIKLSKLEKIFITHLHGDHIYGLPGILTSRSFQSTATPVTIYGPQGIEEMILKILEISAAHLPYSLYIHEIEEGLVFEDNTFDVSCRLLQHKIQSFGYRFEEKPRKGRLLRKKLDALRIPAGPIFQQLKNNRDVSLSDGTILKSEHFVSKPPKSRIVAICGDTMPCEATKAVAYQATVLVHEATYQTQDADRANHHYHSTSLQAASIASEAKVETLILTHFSGRYDDNACTQLLQEAQSVFTNTYIADDHDCYTICNETMSKTTLKSTKNDNVSSATLLHANACPSHNAREKQL